MAFDIETLINSETGEYDWTVIKRQAVVRAQDNHRSCAPPVSWVRDEIRALQYMAFGLRNRWREAHGLPDDTEYSVITPYGRQVEGLRRSAF